MYKRNLIASGILVILIVVGIIFTVMGTVDADTNEPSEPQTQPTLTSVSIATITVPTRVITPTPTATPTPSPSPTPTPIPTPTSVPVNQDDLYLMAHLIWGEAGYDNPDMMYAIGSVVLNRVNHSAYPDTISGVIYQSGQYACTWDGNFDKTPSELAWQIAEDLLINGSTLPENVVYQAQFTQGSGVYLQIENEYFCYY